MITNGYLNHLITIGKRSDEARELVDSLNLMTKKLSSVRLGICTRGFCHTRVLLSGIQRVSFILDSR